jgi:hypothetical protein
MLAWVHHLFNLMFEAAALVPASLGSTWIGLFFPLWIFIVAEIMSGAFNGFKTLKAWLKNTVTAAVTAIAAWGILFLCCIVGAVYRDHNYFVHKAAAFRLESVDAKIDRDRSITKAGKDFGSQLSSLQRSCDKTEGRAETLNDQNRDQQTLIAGCQEDAIKRLTPDPQKITPVALERTFSGEDHVDSYLLITNRPVTPTNIAGFCDVGLDSIEATILGGDGNSSGGSGIENPSERIRFGQVIPPSRIYINFSMPAWTATTPIRMKITYHGPKLTECGFRLR